jgi:hypothetical protein
VYWPGINLKCCCSVCCGCCCVLSCPAAGVVREVYQGKAASFACSGLKPAAVYVLSVKVTYDDGSTLWSDSRAYRTKML